jgi:hypothetical protein
MIAMEYGDISMKCLTEALEDAAIFVERYDADTLYLSEGLCYPIWLHAP